MTAESEDEGEELTDYAPEQTEVMPGCLVIFDTDAFADALKCIAVQMTEEGALYVVDRDTHMLRPIKLAAEPKLTRVQ